MIPVKAAIFTTEINEDTEKILKMEKNR